MINIDNYLNISRNIDFNMLPTALQSGDKLTKGAATNNWSAYNANENIKRVVDIYLQKLDEYLQKNPQAKSETQSQSTALVRVDKTSTAKKTKTKIAKPKTAKAKTAKPKKEKPVKAKKVKPTKNKPEPVEKVLPEINFIKRYIGLHDKEKTQSEILRFISALQKAILEKRIRKTSPYSTEIENIQNQLIKCYEKMGDTIKINIDKTTLDKYKGIAYSQKSMLSVTYIKQYISINGKKNVKEKAKVLMAKLKKAVEKNKIIQTDPYAERLNKLYIALNHYIEGKTPTPEISKSELNGLMGIAGYSQKKSPNLNGVKDNYKTAEVIPSEELAGMEFETIGLQGKFRELIGDPCVGFSAMVYGLPKSGKSTLCIDFAKYLAQHHGKVLYVAIEEGFGYTLKEKLERLRAIHPNIYVSEDIPNDLSDYDYVFIDSVSRAKLTIEDLNNLKKTNTGIAFIFVFHTTKNGQFKGQNQFAHDVDVIIEVADEKAKGNGRFGWGEVEV